MNRKGFTLVEAIVVVGIILVLGLALWPRIAANRAAEIYAEAKALGQQVGAAVAAFLVQDPDRAPRDLAAQAGLPTASPPPGVNNPGWTYYDCTRGANLSPSVRWPAAAHPNIRCVLGVAGDAYRVYTWQTGDTTRVFIAP